MVGRGTAREFAALLKALTTVADLAHRIELVRSAAEDAGRPRDTVSVSTQIWFTAFGSADDVRASARTGPASRPGASTAAPTCSSGAPTQMAEALLERREAYGLDRISLKEDGTDPVRFCRAVLPLLPG